MNEFAKFADDIKAAARELDGAGVDVAARVARRAMKTAKSVAPVETGTLRDEIHLERQGERVSIEATNRYAAFQEYGTTSMAPNPFMKPAFQRHAPELVAEVERVRNKLVARLS